jgi:hypothetical protein
VAAGSAFDRRRRVVGAELLVLGRSCSVLSDHPPKDNVAALLREKCAMPVFPLEIGKQ